MTNAIHYKFGTNAHTKLNGKYKICFVNPRISVLEVKRYIIKTHGETLSAAWKQKRFDLCISDVVTGEEHKAHSFMLNPNQYITIKKSNTRNVTEEDFEEISQTPDFTNIVIASNAEEVAISNLMHEASTSTTLCKNLPFSLNEQKTKPPPQNWISNKALAKQLVGAGPSNSNAIPPPFYICNKCGAKGKHFLRWCPDHASSNDVARSVSLAYKPLASSLMSVEDPKNLTQESFGTPGFFKPVLSSHSSTSASNLNVVTTFNVYNQDYQNKDEQIDSECVITKTQDSSFICSVCEEYLNCAQVVECCFVSFCKSCIQTRQQCPMCSSSPFVFKPNDKLQNAVNYYVLQNNAECLSNNSCKRVKLETQHQQSSVKYNQYYQQQQQHVAVAQQ